MKLLFDENLSPALADAVAKSFPDVVHVEQVLSRGASDRHIWEYAAEHDCAIVSKDTDFRQRAFLHGHPPKVIWLSVGNAGTARIASLLNANAPRIRSFLADAETAMLVLGMS